MIIFVTTAQHRATIRDLVHLPDPPVMRGWSWEHFFQARHFPRATYILTDFDRLATSDVERAGRFYDELVARGMRVLNDPRLFLPRDVFLRRMHRQGINSFTCWRPAEGEQPDRFPVFLRTIAAHRGVLTDLLNSQPEVDEAIAAAVAKGHPLFDLLVVEYAAAPSAPGRFEKRAAYAIGSSIFPGPIANDDSWVAKFGKLGLATDEAYAAQLQEARDMPHNAHMARVFALAGATFGRIDYSILNGRPEIYELNTNPYFRAFNDHPNADRLATIALEKQRLSAALNQIDTIACASPSTWCPACKTYIAGEFGVGIDLGRHRYP